MRGGYYTIKLVIDIKNMENKKYDPLPDEIEKAKEAMTSEQKSLSEVRLEGHEIGSASQKENRKQLAREVLQNLLNVMDDLIATYKNENAWNSRRRSQIDPNRANPYWRYLLERDIAKIKGIQDFIHMGSMFSTSFLKNKLLEEIDKSEAEEADEKFQAKWQELERLDDEFVKKYGLGKR